MDNERIEGFKERYDLQLVIPLDDPESASESVFKDKNVKKVGFASGEFCIPFSRRNVSDIFSYKFWKYPEQRAEIFRRSIIDSDVKYKLAAILAITHPEETLFIRHVETYFFRLVEWLSSNKAKLIEADKLLRRLMEIGAIDRENYVYEYISLTRLFEKSDKMRPVIEGYITEKFGNITDEYPELSQGKAEALKKKLGIDGLLFCDTYAGAEPYVLFNSDKDLKVGLYAKGVCIPAALTPDLASRMGNICATVNGPYEGSWNFLSDEAKLPCAIGLYITCNRPDFCKKYISRFAEDAVMLLLSEDCIPLLKDMLDVGIISDSKKKKILSKLKKTENVPTEIMELFGGKSAAPSPAKSSAAKKAIPAQELPEGFVTDKGQLQEIGAGPYKELVLPEGIISIKQDCIGDVKIKKLVLPATLKKIARACFKNCTGISEIVVSEGTENIGDDAFAGCSSLKSVYIPSTVKRVGERAFKDCVKLEAAVLSEGIMSLGNKLFLNCSKLKTVVIPFTVTDMGINLFENCGSLGSVSFNAPFGSPVSMKEMFKKCRSLERISFSPDDKIYSSLDGVVFNSSQTEIIFIPEKNKNLTLPEDFKEYEVNEAVRELTLHITPGETSRIRVNNSSVKILHFICNDKVYTFDLINIGLFVNEHIYGRDYLYPNEKRAIIDLVNEIIFMISSGKYEVAEDLGLVVYRDHSGFGAADIAPLFGLRIDIAKAIAEIYGEDIETVAAVLVGFLVDSYKNRENDEYLISLVCDYFTKHLDQIYALNNYPSLREAAISASS